jgi:hypothetical protein
VVCLPPPPFGRSLIFRNQSPPLSHGRGKYQPKAFAVRTNMYKREGEMKKCERKGSKQENEHRILKLKDQNIAKGH